MGKKGVKRGDSSQITGLKKIGSRRPGAPMKCKFLKREKNTVRKSCCSENHEIKYDFLLVLIILYNNITTASIVGVS